MPSAAVILGRQESIFLITDDLIENFFANSKPSTAFKRALIKSKKSFAEALYLGAAVTNSK